MSIAGQDVRSSDFLPEFAAAPDGTLYAVWQDRRFSPTGASKIALSRSTDGGLHWSAPIRVDQSPGDTPAFLPQIHVSPGRHRRRPLLRPRERDRSAARADRCVHRPLPRRDVELRRPGELGGRRRDAADDHRLVRLPDRARRRRLFLGDYDGLTSSGETFKAFFDASQPVATSGRTDPFFTTGG